MTSALPQYGPKMPQMENNGNYAVYVHMCAPISV